MPLFKSSKSRFGRNRYARRSTAASKIQSAWRRKKYRKDFVKTKTDVKKIVQRMEQMSYDQYNISPALSSSPSILTNFTNFTFKNETNNPPDRDDLTQRTTQKVFLSTIRIAGQMNVSDATNRLRLCVFRAKRSNQNANPIAAQDCFNDVGNPGGSWLNAPINYRNVDCLWDTQFNVQEQAAGAVWPPYKVLKKVFTLKKNLKFNLNDLDNSDFPVNNYTYFLVGMSDSAITPHPSGRLQITVSFKNIGN